LSEAATDQTAASVDVILRDGSTLRLRAPAREDAGALAAFFTALSERSFYLRFHGVRRVDDDLVRHFLDPDWQDRGVLVGELDDRIVAVAEYMRLRDESAAEAAFAVADELQGRGIGTRLLERLAVLAAEQGIERFVAEVMPENRAMLGVFEGTGLEVTESWKTVSSKSASRSHRRSAIGSVSTSATTSPSLPPSAPSSSRSRSP
jgi:RimJ/RimL family protein N-acetyltransferase